MDLVFFSSSVWWFEVEGYGVCEPQVFLRSLRYEWIIGTLRTPWNSNIWKRLRPHQARQARSYHISPSTKLSKQNAIATVPMPNSQEEWHRVHGEWIVSQLVAAHIVAIGRVLLGNRQDGGLLSCPLLRGPRSAACFRSPMLLDSTCL